MSPADVAHACLVEVGRKDLADEVWWFDEDGGYLEYDSEILSPEDWAVMDRAENLARASIGNPPMERPQL